VTFFRPLAIAALALALCALPAGATVHLLFASLDGAQEVPANVTPGTGDAQITYDDVTNDLDWVITFSNLVGTTTDAHFHGPATYGVPAGVQIGIPHTDGLTADTLIGSATLTATQETQLLSFLWYINIHTTFDGTGEIRGQVVPEPGTLGLLALGLGALALRRR
jgi:hypothetical protein